jgi:hypothetical protein
LDIKHRHTSLVNVLAFVKAQFADPNPVDAVVLLGLKDAGAATAR